MGRKSDITDFVKGQIVALSSKECSQVEISRMLNISRHAVQNAIHRGSVTRRQNCARPRKTTPREDRMLKNIVNLSPHTSSSRVAQVARERGIMISSRTVRRRLTTDFSLVARRPARKPVMTKAQIRGRIRFCKALQNKSADWWECVMFTDESRFQQVRGCGYNYVRRPPGERFNPKYTVKTVKIAPSVMVWGAIAATGHCGLHIFEKGEYVNAAKYISVLEKKVKLHMDISGTTKLQQDSAPCHTAASVKKWLKDNNIQLLENWPSNSPDLNVIENCWNLMKRRVAEQRPKSEEDLKCILKRVWVNEIMPDYCKCLVRSMPDRPKAVLKNKGYPTKY